MAGLVIAGVVAGALAPARAQTPPYPTLKPIRLIAPFPGGSAIDTIARALAEAMGPVLKQKVIVEPMPGAGTVIGTQYVIRQPADGYTLLMLTNSGAIKSALPRPPFDVRKDLAYVGQFSTTPLYLSINSALPYRNVQELIAYARSNPGKLNISSYGIGTMSHLAAELFKNQAKVSLVHIPYSGATANGMALAQGATQVTFDQFGTMLPHIEKGTVRYLAVATPSRQQEAPEVPTLRESGVDLVASNWGGIAVPAGTPTEVIDLLSKALSAALKDPAVIAFYKRFGLHAPAEPWSPSAYAALVQRNVDEFSRVIREARLDIE
jgi:tripartite-type tricarboxylate transporter receptor subunit TctC